jgi:hypothetical protein
MGATARRTTRGTQGATTGGENRGNDSLDRVGMVDAHNLRDSHAWTMAMIIVDSELA